ncbi:unnamed protein product [Effrenium voratum]|uniref:Uncharacterized protein n=1 Tax=Effrenium voratum TaxID=2562239 RepID=A0AA36IML6_9DINO|nr:unnamed protein product [Effrenium voratum]CAJ1437232.1 unnamed protein product [Effrenium voratum]
MAAAAEFQPEAWEARREDDDEFMPRHWEAGAPPAVLLPHQGPLAGPQDDEFVPAVWQGQSLTQHPPPLLGPSRARGGKRKVASLDESCWCPGQPGAPQAGPERASPEHGNSYQRNGCNPDRIREVLSHPQAQCRCRRLCHTRLSQRRILAVCRAFWQMSDAERAHMLRAVYFAAAGPDPAGRAGSEESESHESRCKRQWQLCGQQVCLSNFACILGTSQSSIWKQIYGQPDRRAGSLSARFTQATAASMAVDWWLWELYNSAAEPLPDHPKPKKAVKTSSASHFWMDEPWLRPGDRVASEVASEGSSDEFQPEDLGIGWVHPPYEGILAPGNGNAGDHASCAEHGDGGDQTSLKWSPDHPVVDQLSAWTVASQRPSIGLPVRYLQHTTLHSLYWLFTASWDTIKEHLPSGATKQAKDGPPSYRTFCARWKCWRRYIRIRKRSQHAQCTICWDLHTC